MARNIISGRYGSVQRLLPLEDGSGWYPLSTDNRGPFDNTGQGSQPPTPATAASLTDEGTILTGNGGYTPHASTVSAVTSWTLENQAAPIKYTASNTRGYSGKLEGVHNASGNIAGIGAVPPIAPGQRFRFYGYVGPDNGRLDNYRGTVYRITAIANSVQIQINYQLQNPCTWTVGWMSDWKNPGDELWVNRLNSSHTAELGAYGFWDYTTLDCSTLLPSSESCLWLEGVDKPVCLLDANIQFNTDTSPFTNSCSSSVGGWQSVVVGPTDCTVSTNIHGDNYGDLYSTDAVSDYYDGVPYADLKTSEKMRKFWAGSNHAMRIHVGNTGAYWEFYKLMVTGFGGLNVDTTSNNPVQFSCNMEFNAYPTVRGACLPGYIIYNTGTVPGNASLSNRNLALVDLRPGNDSHESYLGAGDEYLRQENGVPLEDGAFEWWLSSCAGGGQAGANGKFYPNLDV